MTIRLRAIVLLLSALFLMSTGLAGAQDDGIEQVGLRLTDIAPLSDVEAAYDADFRMQSVVLSPDGTQLAWAIQEGICVLEFEGAVTCFEDAEQPLQVGSALYWSPDSRAIAFHEDVLRRFNESDIWLLDLDAGQFANLTDDGITGGFMQVDDTLHLDLLPTWDPATGDLYFFRLTRTAEGEDINAVYRVRAGDLQAGAEAELVADLREAFPVPFPIFALPVESLGGSATIAPDGSTLAFVARPAPDPVAQSGVWLLDLASGAYEPFALRTTIVGTGLPEWYLEGEGFETDLLDGLAWLPDSTTLVASSINAAGMPQTLAPMLYRLDTASGDITSLRDLSEVPNFESYFTAPFGDDDLPAIWGRQMFGALLPGGAGIVYANGVVQSVDEVAFSAWLLDAEAGAEQPVQLATVPHDTFTVLPVYRSSAGASGDVVRVLTHGYLLTFEVIA